MRGPALPGPFVFQALVRETFLVFLCGPERLINFTGNVDLPGWLCENPPRIALSAALAHRPFRLIAYILMIQLGVRILPAVLAVIAGVMDWKSRRIPNWLTVPSLVVGIAVNTWLRGWRGTKESLLGAGLGLILLLPFVLLRSLGAGDWKLVGALGAFVGPQRLITVLFVTVLAAGIMALVLVIWKRRFIETMRNIAHLLASLFSFQFPGQELTLDNPQSIKVPFGVAVAVAIIVYTAGQGWYLS
jgi:prepilin peptidase CpaA